MYSPMPVAPATPPAPFCASTTGADHSPVAIVSVAPELLAVAAVTYSGLLPAGIVVLQPLLMPVRLLVANVYVAVLDGTVGALAARW